MTTQEFYLQNMEAELPRFERVFLAVLADKANWRPHEKSRSAIDLVQVITFNAVACPIFLKTGLMDYEKVPKPQARSAPEYWTLCKRAFDESVSIAKGMSDKDWNSDARMMLGNTVLWETTKGEMAWGILLDSIHHRGQLSVYLRPMGSKVPSIYGPSGDTA